MKDIRGHFSISPLCSSELYVFRGIKNNIDSIDEKHLDKMIMNECGKKELVKLNTIINKKKFILGLIKEKQSTLYNDWMKDTGYSLFKSHITKILRYYKIMIKYHIINDLNTIATMQITDFDSITNKIDSINKRLLNLKHVEPTYIITSDIIELLTNIINKINKYIETGFDSYSASTVNLADTYISKIASFYNKVKNLFNTNPFETTQNDLKNKRFRLLNNELSKQFNKDIFQELYENNKINITQYRESIKNTLTIGEIIPATHPNYPYKTNKTTSLYIQLYDKPNIIQNTITILNNISQITKNNSENIYIYIIIIEFTLNKYHIFYDEQHEYIDGQCKYASNDSDREEYKNNFPKYRKDFINLIKIISKYTNNNIDCIYDILIFYFKYTFTKIYRDTKCNISNHIDWIHRNQHLITSSPDEVSYLYYKIQFELEKKLKIEPYLKTILNYKDYLDINVEMTKILKTLCNIFNVKNTITNDENDDEFKDAISIVGDTIIGANPFEDNEDYKDTDNDSTVYNKACQNTKNYVNKTSHV